MKIESNTEKNLARRKFPFLSVCGFLDVASLFLKGSFSQFSHYKCTSATMENMNWHTVNSSLSLWRLYALVFAVDGLLVWCCVDIHFVWAFMILNFNKINSNNTFCVHGANTVFATFICEIRQNALTKNGRKWSRVWAHNWGFVVGKNSWSVKWNSSSSRNHTHRVIEAKAQTTYRKKDNNRLFVPKHSKFTKLKFLSFFDDDDVEKTYCPNPTKIYFEIKHSTFNVFTYIMLNIAISLYMQQQKLTANNRPIQWKLN